MGKFSHKKELKKHVLISLSESRCQLEQEINKVRECVHVPHRVYQSLKRAPLKGVALSFLASFFLGKFFFAKKRKKKTPQKFSQKTVKDTLGGFFLKIVLDASKPYLINFLKKSLPKWLKKH